MRVNNSSSGANNASIASTETAKAKDTSPRQVESHSRSDNFDHVALSRLSRTLGNTDEAHLEKLRAAVASGSYSLSSWQAGSRIIDEHIANSGERS